MLLYHTDDLQPESELGDGDLVLPSEKNEALCGARRKVKEKKKIKNNLLIYNTLMVKIIFSPY